MNTLWLILAAVCWLRGWWLMPSSATEARSAMAPYRAARSVLLVLVGWGCFLGGIGVRFAVVLGA